MIRDIIPVLEYSFKDVYHGIVYPVQSKGIWVPGSRDGNVYKDAVPDSRKKSIVYWEDYGGEVYSRTARWQRIRQRVRLIVWLNEAKIETPYDDNIREILQAVPKRQGNTFFQLTGQHHKDIDIFERYEYGEAKQYITYPFDVAAFDYNILYFMPCT